MKEKPYWKITEWSNGWNNDPDFDSPLFDRMAKELLKNQEIEKVIKILYQEFVKIIIRKKNWPKKSIQIVSIMTQMFSKTHTNAKCG